MRTGGQFLFATCFTAFFERTGGSPRPGVWARWVAPRASGPLGVLGAPPLPLPHPPGVGSPWPRLGDPNTSGGGGGFGGVGGGGIPPHPDAYKDMSSVAAEAQNIFGPSSQATGRTEAFLGQAFSLLTGQVSSILAAYISRSPVTCGSCNAGSCHLAIGAAVEPLAEELRRCRVSNPSDPAPCPSVVCECPSNAGFVLAAWLFGVLCGLAAVFFLRPTPERLPALANVKGKGKGYNALGSQSTVEPAAEPPTGTIPLPSSASSSGVATPKTTKKNG